MTSLSSAGQGQPNLRVLQHKSPNVARQTAANRSTSAYAVPAVGSKVHKDSASMSAPAASVSPVMPDTADNVYDSTQTQKTSDTTVDVLSVGDEHAALIASIPGQVDVQEHRSDCLLPVASSHCKSFACFKTAD